MAFDLPGWKIVERYRIAIGATAIGVRRIGGDVAWERICQFGRREQSRLCRASGPRSVAVAPDAVSPFDDLALGVKASFDLDRHRRAERRMCHLVLARPLHPDRPTASGFRKQNRIERDIIGRVMPVAAGALHMLYANVFERICEHQREIGAEKINPLAVRPDVDARSGPLRDGAGLRERGMREIGAGVMSPGPG